jgi:hypothetical protein
MDVSLIISVSALTGLFASLGTIWFTRKNLRTSKYIDTIISERIKWIQIVREDLTELISSILIHLKNADHLNELMDEKENQDYLNYTRSRDACSYSNDELQASRTLNRDITNIENAMNKVLMRSEIVNKAILLKLRFNQEDVEIIDHLNLIIEQFADYSKQIKDIHININGLTEKGQNVLKREWRAVKIEVNKI